MKEQAHTPGPWQAKLKRTSYGGRLPPLVTAAGKVVVIVDGDAPIYGADGDRDYEAEAAQDDANALLIAQAPALLDLALGVMELTDGTFTEVDILENLSRMGEEARALLGKVRGGGGR